MPKPKRTLSERIDGLERRFEKHEHFLENGLSKKIADIVATEVMNKVESRLSHMEGKLEGHVGAPPPSRKQITIRQLMEVGLVALMVVGVLGAITLFIMGKMTADDAAKIIAAIRGGG